MRAETPNADAIETAADPQDDVTRQLERRDELMLFDAALAGLELEQRAVFTLFELEGMTGQAIAELLEVPLGTVYSRLRLARAAFHQHLKRHAARAARPAPTLKRGS